MLLSTVELLRCPACCGRDFAVHGGQGNAVADGALQCRACRREYPVRGGIPVFLSGEMVLSSHHSGFAALDADVQQKIRQREWHDTAHMEDDYKQVSYDADGLFAFLLYYQLREVEPILRDRSYPRIANICSGLGFDLEFLARLGKDILAADISWNSLCKTQEKGRTLGIEVEAVCCDAENLPFFDNSFDLVLTHHSFHHLANPLRGLFEMVRVSRHRAAFFEPSKGLTRSLIRKLGLKPEVEESGNVVYEFGDQQLQTFCKDHALSLRYFHKCLITGPMHEPSLFRDLDRLGLSSILSASVSLANRAFGSVIGTKCGVVIEKNGSNGMAHRS